MRKRSGTFPAGREDVDRIDDLFRIGVVPLIQEDSDLPVTPSGSRGIARPRQLCARHGTASASVGLRHIPVVDLQFRTHLQFDKRIGRTGNPCFPVDVVDPDRELRSPPGGTVEENQTLVFPAHRDLLDRIRKHADFLGSGKSNQSFPIIRRGIDDVEGHSAQDLLPGREGGKIVGWPLRGPAADRSIRIIPESPVAELCN